MIGLQILAMRLPFRIAAGLPLPWYRTAVHFFWWVCVSIFTAAAVGFAAANLVVLSAPLSSEDARDFAGRVAGLVTGTVWGVGGLVWGVGLVWGLRQLRGDPTHAPLRMHRRLALLSFLVSAVEGIVLLMNTLFSRWQPDFHRIYYYNLSRVVFSYSVFPLFFLLGPQLSISYLRRIRRVELVVPRSERSRLLAPIRWITSFFQRRYPQAHIPGQPN